MSTEEKQPYFSKRIRIGDVTSPKDLIGFKEFTVELTYRNQETKIIINRNPIKEIRK